VFSPVFETDDGIPVYFSCAKESDEDLVTIEYLRDIALQAGLDGRHIFIEDIGYNLGIGRFCDLEDNEIQKMFKLYPWEWLLADDFGKYISTDAVRFYEPAWKLVLSSKGILPVLWEMFPGHPNLLQSYSDAARLTVGYARNRFFEEGRTYSCQGLTRSVTWSSGGALWTGGVHISGGKELPV
jgi:glutathionylspermidine synthase